MALAVKPSDERAAPRLYTLTSGSLEDVYLESASGEGEGVDVTVMHSVRVPIANAVTAGSPKADILTAVNGGALSGEAFGPA